VSDPRVVKSSIEVPVEKLLCAQEGCNGEMRFTGLEPGSGSSSLKHICTVCGAEEEREIQYPRILPEEVP